MASKKWYVAGLHFECAQSGNCCSGPPGYVWVTKDDVARIGKHIGNGSDGLGKEHLRRVGLRHSLTEKPDGDCTFLKRDGECTTCSIYEVRPRQCRTWPFWPENLKSPDAWNRAAQTCPGMNRGKHHDFVAIEEVRHRKSI